MYFIGGKNETNIHLKKSRSMQRSGTDTIRPIFTLRILQHFAPT